jgi:hypothetical protein
MATLDNGGFDLVVTVSEPTLSGAARTLAPVTVPSQPINNAMLVGTVEPSASVVGATLPGGVDLTVTIDLAGTVIHVTSAALLGGAMQPVPAHLADIPIAGTVAVTGRFSTGGPGGTTVFADFTPQGSYPIVSPSLDENASLAAPLVVLLLANAIISNPTDPNAYATARSTVVALLTSAVTTAVRDAVRGLRTPIATPPPGLPITGLTLFETPRFALTLAYTMGGPGGSPSAVGRLNVLTNTATGAPLDAVVLTLANGGIFRDLVRPALTAALGLTPGGFLPGPQFAWFGSVPLTPPGGLPTGVAGITLESLVLGIDESGRLRVTGTALGTGVGGTFTVTTSVDQAFTIGATPLPGRNGFLLTLTPAGPPTVTTDVQIPAWVYVASALTGGALLVTVLVTIDLFGGTLISGPIAGAITAAIGPGLSVPVTLAGLPPLTPRLLTSFQADSASRTVSVSFLPPIPFPFRDHDVIVNLV